MHYLDAEAIENIAIEIAFLGAGGDGDPYISKMMALPTIEKNGLVKLVSPEEIATKDFFLPAAVTSTPSIIIEKFPKGDGFVHVSEKLGKYLDQEMIAGTLPMEARDVNSMIPIVVTAKLDIPLVSCDGMGRVFPELPMVTLHLSEMSAALMAAADEKRNTDIIEAIDSTWTERLTHIQTAGMGASALVNVCPATGKRSQDHGVHNITTLSEEIGKVIRDTYADEQKKRQTLVEITDGLELFQGETLDVEREVKGGLDLGRVKLSGLGGDAGSEAVIHFQNRSLIAEKDGQVTVMTPDLICMIGLETLTPVTIESLKYSRCVQVVGLKVSIIWRMKKGIEAVDPRYFSYEMDYQPLGNLVTKEDE